MPAYHSGRLSKTDRPDYNYPLRPTTKDLTVPFAPRNLIITSPYSVGATDIRWDNPKIIPQNSGLQITGCNVYRATDSPYGAYIKVNDTPVTVLFYRDETKEELVTNENATATLRYHEPSGKWSVFASHRPIIMPGTNGRFSTRIQDVVVDIDDGDGSFIEVPAYSVNGVTGEITLISYPTFNYQVQQIIPPRLPKPPNGRVRISYRYLKYQVLTVLNQRIYYKVTTVAVDPNNGNQTIETPLEEISCRSIFDIEAMDYIWREAIHRNRWILDQGGERVKLFIRKWMGEKCPDYQVNYGQSHSDCHVCFPAGQKVTLADGSIKNIEEIKINNEVLTIDGRKSLVEEVFDRDYEDNLYEINSYGKDPIKCTKDHPFFILKKEDSSCIKYSKKYNKNKCTTLSKKICFRDNNICHHKLKFSWVNASELKVGDYILVPKYKMKKTKFSENLMFLFGIYLAEGHIGFHKGIPDSVNFSMGAHERKLIEFIKSIFHSEFSLNLKEKKESRGAIVLYKNSKKISTMFLKNCGHDAHHKKMHKKLMCSEEKGLFSLLKGYIMGDGCLSKKDGSRGIAYSTVSDNMASQLELILAILNIPSSNKMYYHEEKRDGWGKSHWYHSGKINMYHAKKLELLYEKEIKKEVLKKQHKILNVEDYIAHPINKINKELFKGKVYNLRISRNNTYLVNNVIVHNCLGTGIVGGFSGPYDAIIAPPETEKMVELADMGLHIRYDWATWMTDYPLINPRDVIVRQNNERYIVGPVNPQGQRGVIMQQHFTMSYLDQGDIIYKIPITGGETSVPASYDPYRQTAPTEASPAINDKPEIPKERIIRGKTVTWENIAY